MSFLTILYAILFYAATALLLVGLGRKIAQYARTPAPLKIPTMPAPTTRGGAILRVGMEVVFFRQLFRSNKWIWLFGYLFHFGLFLVLARHIRYFQEPVWDWVVFIQPFGKYASFAMVAGLIGLWGRRLLVERIRYISAPSDHLMLLLLLAIGLSGMSMTFVSHTDIVGLKAFLLGLMRFDLGNELPADALLLIHLTLVATLMIIFPISKLLHAPGVFFSPTLNQVDNSREKRHLAPWAAELDADRSE